MLWEDILGWSRYNCSKRTRSGEWVRAGTKRGEIFLPFWTLIANILCAWSVFVILFLHWISSLALPAAMNQLCLLPLAQDFLSTARISASSSNCSKSNHWLGNEIWIVSLPVAFLWGECLWKRFWKPVWKMWHFPAESESLSVGTQAVLGHYS